MHKTVGIESHIAKPFIAYNRKRLALRESACEMKIIHKTCSLTDHAGAAYTITASQY